MLPVPGLSAPSIAAAYTGAGDAAATPRPARHRAYPSRAFRRRAASLAGCAVRTAGPSRSWRRLRSRTGAAATADRRSTPETRAFWAGSETANVTSRRAAALVDAHERGHAPLGVTAAGQPGVQRGAVRRVDAGEPVPARLLAAERGLPAELGLSRGVRRGAGRVDDAPPSRRERQGGALPARVDRDVARHDLSATSPSSTWSTRSATRSRSRVIRRVVHLVPGGGRWRSICYPDVTAD